MKFSQVIGLFLIISGTAAITNEYIRKKYDIPEFTPVHWQGDMFDSEDILGEKKMFQLDSLYLSLNPCAYDGVILWPDSMSFMKIGIRWQAIDFIYLDDNGGGIQVSYYSLTPDSAVINLANFIKKELPCK